MTESATSFGILAAGIEDLIEILIPIVFVLIYVLGGMAKALAEKKNRIIRGQEETGEKPSKKEKKSPYPPIQAEFRPRSRRLPYAQAVSEAPKPPPPKKQPKKSGSVFEELESLKQIRLDRIQARLKQIQQQAGIQPPVRPQPRSSLQAHPTKAAVPGPQSRHTIPTAQPVTATKSVQYSRERIKKKMKMDVSQPDVLAPMVPTIQQDLIRMMRNPTDLRKAVLAAEILEKPVALR